MRHLRCVQKDANPKDLPLKPIFETDKETTPTWTENPTKWDKPILTYCLLRGTKDIEGETEETFAVGLATSAWEAEANIKIIKVKSTQNPDITIAWLDPQEDEMFKASPNGILAWAGYPKTSFQGKLRLNDNVIWTWNGHSISADEYTRITGKPVADPRNTFKTYNLNQTLRHEIGHLLGLAHSQSCSSCIMNWAYNDSLELQDDDIKRIVAKYGKRTWKSGVYLRFKAAMYRLTRTKPD